MLWLLMSRGRGRGVLLRRPLRFLDVRGLHLSWRCFHSVRGFDCSRRCGLDWRPDIPVRNKALAVLLGLNVSHLRRVIDRGRRVTDRGRMIHGYRPMGGYDAMA